MIYELNISFESEVDAFNLHVPEKFMEIIETELFYVYLKTDEHKPR